MLILKFIVEWSPVDWKIRRWLWLQMWHENWLPNTVITEKDLAQFLSWWCQQFTLLLLSSLSFTRFINDRPSAGSWDCVSSWGGHPLDKLGQSELIWEFIWCALSGVLSATRYHSDCNCLLIWCGLRSHVDRTRLLVEQALTDLSQLLMLLLLLWLLWMLLGWATRANQWAKLDVTRDFGASGWLLELLGRGGLARQHGCRWLLFWEMLGLTNGLGVSSWILGTVLATRRRLALGLFLLRWWLRLRFQWIVRICVWVFTGATKFWVRLHRLLLVGHTALVAYWGAFLGWWACVLQFFRVLGGSGAFTLTSATLILTFVVLLLIFIRSRSSGRIWFSFWLV